MHCSFLTQVVPCCLHRWHQCFPSYVASCSLGEVAFDNRTCTLCMFLDSVPICHFLAPVEASNGLPVALYPVIVFCFSYVAVLRELAFNNRISVLPVLSLVNKPLNSTGYQFCSYYPFKPLNCICGLVLSSDVLYYVSATFAHTKVVSLLEGRPHLLCPIAPSSRVAAH